jgi:NAD(P)H-hydrate epimerase
MEELPMKCVTATVMRELDNQVIESGVPGIRLMERAGEGVFSVLVDLLSRLKPVHRRRLTLLAGKGNNGGDAWVVAQLAATQLNLPVTVCSTVPIEELQGDCRYWAAQVPETVLVLVPGDELPPEALTPGTVVVDGLLGTGTQGPAKGVCSAWIHQVNAARLPVLSIDIPSGLSADTGDAEGGVISAMATAVIGLWKPGLFSDTGRPNCGRLSLVDIGIPQELVEDVPAVLEVIDTDAAAAIMPVRPAAGHKGTFGHVVILAGSAAYSGAPVLSGIAAARSGCGLVTVVVPAGVMATLPPRPAALMMREAPACADGTFDGVEAAVVLDSLLDKADAVVFGPGIGRNRQTTPLLETVFTVGRAGVIDADGIWHLASSGGGWCGENHVITPHPGEMRPLLEAAGMDKLMDAPRQRQARALAQATGGVVVLKGLGTIIASPDRLAVVAVGNNGLATGGSGDVLSGLIAGLQAQGLGPFEAAALGAWIHGRAAELADTGTRALIADDLPLLFDRVFKELTSFA